MKILEMLQDSQVLIKDGAMGTLLIAQGLKLGQPTAEWNKEFPDRVRRVHEAYISAGANLILANTFSANGEQLKRSKYGVSELVSAGVAIAKSAVRTARQPCFALLDVGPLGQLLEPYGDLEMDEAVSLYRTAIEAGANAGADAILLETMSDLYEAEAAIRAARACCDLPVLATMTFGESGKTFMGVDVKSMAETLTELGVSALGSNCGLGPEQMQKLLPEFLASTQLPIMMSPNAGLPRYADGAAVHDLTPADFAEMMQQLYQAGARILGGCCGTTPEHIRALTERIGK